MCLSVRSLSAGHHTTSPDLTSPHLSWPDPTRRLQISINSAPSGAQLTNKQYKSDSEDGRRGLVSVQRRKTNVNTSKAPAATLSEHFYFLASTPPKHCRSSQPANVLLPGELMSFEAIKLSAPALNINNYFKTGEARKRASAQHVMCIYSIHTCIYKPSELLVSNLHWAVTTEFVSSPEQPNSLRGGEI